MSIPHKLVLSILMLQNLKMNITDVGLEKSLLIIKFMEEITNSLSLMLLKIIMFKLIVIVPLFIMKSH